MKKRTVIMELTYLHHVGLLSGCGRVLATFNDGWRLDKDGVLHIYDIYEITEAN